MKNKVVKNTTSLYLMNIAKLILPLITLPYLTRVLTKDCYGAVSYIKAVMQYMQIIVDFGFLLSATKQIVEAGGDKEKISDIISETLLAKCILAALAFCIVIILSFFLPILREYWLLTILSFGTIFLTCFLMDFLFRGIEEMHVITVRYVIMRIISTVFTFIFVKSDANVLWIPILDIVGSIVAIVLVFYELKKRGYRIKVASINKALANLKESLVYFFSNMATTSFTALNTLIIGICLQFNDVANWSVCMQIVAAVQALYSPITDGLYPQMVQKKDLGLVNKVFKYFMILVTLGCILTFFVAKYVLLILGGEKYLDAIPLLRSFIPLLFFSFPAMLYGWPTLGAINRIKETTKTTVITAILQIVGILVLYFVNCISVISLALLRGGTECCMFAMRYIITKKHSSEFKIASTEQVVE